MFAYKWIMAVQIGKQSIAALWEGRKNEVIDLEADVDSDAPEAEELDCVLI